MGYFAYAQYDVKSPIVGVADTSPEGGSDLFVIAMEAKRRSNLPGGWRSTEYKFRTFSVGYFADAQYDVLFLYVILSMSSEQTCLQGFANEDIHKALAFFIKNAENGSFNALALSAE